MMRPKSWFPGVLTKPKNLHSLEHLKYLHSVLCKHTSVTESNSGLLVESMRSISEILIWGDQNDSTVFDFFLEKNMLSFFLSYLQQRHGRFICVQILQTLNILFENISNETSLYYLLSNNHINSIIVHKFDFSDEEVMAYFISFLKTLSLKLNKHTIHFFYNEHTNDFALYTEAIKFFNHSESMVRIAVRTITLNVYKVGDRAMLRYIRDKTAAPYFFNLVWFIGVHVLDLDCCVRNADHMSRDRLEDLVAEHLDHLHYINDIISINIGSLNDILTDHMLNRLFIPLYVYSLSRYNTPPVDLNERKHVISVLALFLLSQVFLIISHKPLVQQLAEVIFHGEVDRTKFDHTDSFPRARIRAFTAPKETLAMSLETFSRRTTTPSPPTVDTPPPTDEATTSTDGGATKSAADQTTATEDDSSDQNITDEEKMGSVAQTAELHLANRPFLSALFSSLECGQNDYDTLFSLCLLYAMGHNEGINQGLMDTVFMPTDRSETKDKYNVVLVEKLIQIITTACQPGSKVRLVTLDLSIRLLKQLVYKSGCSYLQDRHLAAVEHARETSTQLLRNFYKSEEIFLDMFEDEYNEMKTRPLNIEYLMMDASILLAPTGTPLTGIDFNKRLPCGDTERSRRAIRVFFMLRDLSLTLLNDPETNLPLSKDETFVKIDNVLDLNNSDLIACTVTTRDSRRPERRFLVIDCQQLILVEPDTKRLGWGVVRFVGLLQDVVVSGDKDDSRSLHATIHKPSRSVHAHPPPLLSATFIFDDHIRCMAAKQRLTKGRNKARSQKIQAVEKLLDVCDNAQSSQYPSVGPGAGIPGRGHMVRPRSSHVSSHTTTPVIRQPERRSAAPHGAVASSSSGESTTHTAEDRTNTPRNPKASPNRDYVVNSCQTTQITTDDAKNLKSQSLKSTDQMFIKSSNGEALQCEVERLKKLHENPSESSTSRENVDAIEHKLTHAESKEALNVTTETDIDSQNSGKQEIQMQDLSRDRPATKPSTKIAHTSLVSTKSLIASKPPRSHSHSPKRDSHAPKERSKSLSGDSKVSAQKHDGNTSAPKRDSTTQKRDVKPETKTTGSQTTKKSIPQTAGPKSLKPAETPPVSLLHEPDAATTSQTPVLMPPIATRQVKEQGESASKSMKSQITELAQMVQRHYNYDKDG